MKQGGGGWCYQNEPKGKSPLVRQRESTRHKELINQHRAMRAKAPQRRAKYSPITVKHNRHKRKKEILVISFVGVITCRYTCYHLQLLEEGEARFWFMITVQVQVC